MNTQIKILYIDDNIDLKISQYLDRYYNVPNGFEKIYDEIKFGPTQEYETLLNNDKVKTANVILIDSRLFENNQPGLKKFTGEEFMIILKKIYPFIEVIVISQNESEEGIIKVPKQKTSEYPAEKYYENILGEHITSAIKNIKMYKIIAEKLNDNVEIEKVLVEQIIDTMEGSNKYDQLKVGDIDRIIEKFEKLQEKIENDK